MNQTLNFWMSLSVPPAGPNSPFARARMKKFLFVLMFLLGAVSLFAGSSKEFTFMWQVLDALRFSRSAIDYRVIAKKPTREMIADTDAANVNFEKAKQVLDIYTRDEDKAIYNFTSAIINGIDMLIYSNDGFNGKLQSVAGLIPEGFVDTVSETARFRAQNKRGWDELFSSLENQDMKTVISKISKEERQKLIERLDAIFADSGEALTEEEGFEILKEEKRDLQRRFTQAIVNIRERLGD